MPAKWALPFSNPKSARKRCLVLELNVKIVGHPSLDSKPVLLLEVQNRKRFHTQVVCLSKWFDFQNGLVLELNVTTVWHPSLDSKPVLLLEVQNRKRFHTQVVCLSKWFDFQNGLVLELNVTTVWHPSLDSKPVLLLEVSPKRFDTQVVCLPERSFRYFLVFFGSGDASKTTKNSVFRPKAARPASAAYLPSASAWRRPFSKPGMSVEVGWVDELDTSWRVGWVWFNIFKTWVGFLYAR